MGEQRADEQPVDGPGANRSAPADLSWIEELAWILARDSGVDLVSILVLREVLEALPPRQRQLVYERYFEDLQLSEIARREGVAPETIREVLSRALSRIRQLLAQAEPGERSGPGSWRPRG